MGSILHATDQLKLLEDRIARVCGNAQQWAQHAPLRGCLFEKEASVALRNLLYRKGASFMGTYSLYAEDRHEPLQPAAESDHSTSINHVLADAIKRYENESLAEAWLVAQRWPDGVRCPKCDSDNIARPPDSRPQPYRCRDSRTQFSVTSHSALKGSKHSLGTWVKAFHICSAISNPDGVDIRDLLPVTSKAGRYLAMRIHEAWEFYGLNPQASSVQRPLPLSCNLNGRRCVQITVRRRTRPRRILPPPIVDSAEVLARALFSLPQRHTWVFMRGKSFRD